MPFIPDLPAGTGRISATIEGPSIAPETFGRTAKAEALQGLGKSALQFGAELTETRLKSEANDYSLTRNQEYSTKLQNKANELRSKFPDGKGYSEELKLYANDLRNEMLQEAPNGFAQELYGNRSFNTFSHYVTHAENWENETKAKMAVVNFSKVADDFSKPHLKIPNPKNLELDYANFVTSVDISELDPIAKEKAKLEAADTAFNSMLDGYETNENYYGGLKFIGSNNQVVKQIPAEKLGNAQVKFAKLIERKARVDLEVANFNLLNIQSIADNGDLKKIPNAKQQIEQLEKSFISGAGVLKDNQIARKLDDLTLAVVKNDILDEAKRGSPEEISKLIDSVDGRLDKAQTELKAKYPQAAKYGIGEVFNAKNRNAIKSSLQDSLMKMLKTQATDPVQGLEDGYPAIEGLRKQTSLTDPNAAEFNSQYHQTLRGYAAQKNIPLTRITRKSDSMMIANLINSATSPLAKAQVIENINRANGPEASNILKDVAKDSPEIGPEIALLAEIRDQDTQRLILMNADRAKIDNFKSTNSKMYHSIESITERKSKDFMKAMAAGDESNYSATVMKAIREAVVNDAVRLNRDKGMDPDSAVSKSYETIIKRNFYTAKGGRSSIVMPKHLENPALEDFLKKSDNKEYLKQFKIPPSIDFIEQFQKAKMPDIEYKLKQAALIEKLKSGQVGQLTEEESKAVKVKATAALTSELNDAWASHLEENTQWIPNSQKTALILVEKQPNAPFKTILRAPGKPVGVLLRDIYDRKL